jgi:CheY-like chemotaxis protein
LAPHPLPGGALDPTILVLVVDDNWDDRHIMAAMLRYHGFVVVDLSDGFRAFRIAKDWRPQVAIFDLAMPGISGVDLAAAFRADPDLCGTPLVAVTAHPEYGAMARRAGFDAFLQKPLSSSDLVATVQGLLGKEPADQTGEPPRGASP